MWTAMSKSLVLQLHHLIPLQSQAQALLTAIQVDLRAELCNVVKCTFMVSLHDVGSSEGINLRKVLPLEASYIPPPINQVCTQLTLLVIW